MPIGEGLYDRVALEETDDTWELIDGWFRPKPGGTVHRNHVTTCFGFGLMMQLDEAAFRARINSGLLRCFARGSFVPDHFNIPDAPVRPLLGWPDDPEVYDAPMPRVAEVCEPPTDADAASRELRGYRLRGDREIWWLTPATGRCRLAPPADGGYVQADFSGGVVHPIAPPHVAIDLDALVAGRPTVATDPRPPAAQRRPQ
jgi:hypothetical protein